MADDDYLHRSVKANAMWIDKTLWVGSILATLVVVVRLAGGSEFSFQGAKVPLDRIWWLVALLTACHLYATVVFLRSARTMWSRLPEDDCTVVWKDLTTEGGVFMRGMTPRVLPTTGGRLAPMGNEMATWF